MGNWQSWLQNANIGLKVLQHFWPGKFGPKESAPIHIELNPKIAELRAQKEREKKYTYIDPQEVDNASKGLKKYVKLEELDHPNKTSQPVARRFRSNKRSIT